MENKHIGIEIRENALKYHQKKALYFKNIENNTWVGISWTAFVNQVQQISKALLKFGIKERDNIAIFAQNMPEWTIADLGILSIRSVVVPIYATNSKSEVEYIINDAEVSIIFVGGQDEYDKALTVLKSSKFLKLIVAFHNNIEIEEGDHSVYLEDFINEIDDQSIETELQKRYFEGELSDLASIIYTSGTTGEPKGVMLDHQNFADSLKAHELELNVDDSDVSLSILPLSHIYERSWVMFCLHSGIAVYFNADPKQFAEVLQEVKPTIMCTVPRIYEKIYAAIQEKKKTASPTKVKLMNWALSVGNEYFNQYLRNELKVPFILQLKFKVADKLVLSKLRAVFGGRIKFTPCGGAALSSDIVAFFHSFGLNLKCGYGLTETTATASLFGDTKIAFNSAGKPIIGTEIKIGENDEILVKGPGVMRGYYKKPIETAEVFMGDWFRTGDAGKIDEYGNIYITDRIKDLMKTSGGKYIAPQKLETALVNDAFIEQIAVIGDQKNYVTALTVPSFEALKEYANQHKISFSSIEDLIANNQIKEMFTKRFEELQKEFSGFEKIKKFTLLPKEFSIDTGEITATLKLKRKVIQQKYKELIDKMYND
jgi:long-chain acyl-CoA synthetase